MIDLLSIFGWVVKRYLLQFLNGFPVNPFGQKHTGLPASISHIAFKPHGFGSQGLLGGLHPNRPSPLYPGGHLHSGL